MAGRSQEFEDALIKLADVIAFSETTAIDISKLDIDGDLRLAVLIACFFSSIRNAKSISILASNGATAGINGLHRTMLEEQINAKFVLSAKDDLIAKAFFIDGEESLARYIKKMLKNGVIKRFTKPEQDWKIQLGEIQERIRKVKSDEAPVPVKWQRKKEIRALVTGLGDSYYMTEWLFSQDVHGTARAIDKFLEDKSDKIQFNASMITLEKHEKTIINATIGLLVSFMELCSKELKVPDKRNLQALRIP